MRDSTSKGLLKEAFYSFIALCILEICVPNKSVKIHIVYLILYSNNDNTTQVQCGGVAKLPPQNGGRLSSSSSCVPGRFM